MTAKVFEFLDVVRFARPTVSSIDIRLTARDPDLINYLSGRGWGSYKPLWPRMKRVWQGPLSDQEIKDWWKTPWLVDAMMVLRDQYKGAGQWYPIPQGSRLVAGLLFKTSVRGVLHTPEHGAEIHIINPRKSQVVAAEQLAFLARAAYEEYAIDDPNNPKPVVFDMGSKTKNKVRSAIFHRGEAMNMMSAHEFEHVINSFYEAVKLTGFQVPVWSGTITADLFRIPREERR